jgi:hypothetical protein
VYYPKLFGLQSSVGCAVTQNPLPANEVRAGVSCLGQTESAGKAQDKMETMRA